MNPTIELLIEHNLEVQAPIVEDGITWSTSRQGSPGELRFKVKKDDKLNFAEGDVVRLKVDDKEVFFGFVFKKSRTKEHIIEVTAYDQLRYLKNKDTYVLENKTASEIVKMICNDFHMNVGEVEDTEFKIASKVEENTTLFDIIQNALDTTLMNKSEMYVLYDDFGKVTLKNIGNMILDTLITFDTAEDFDYTSSIDSDTYNQVKLTYDNDKTGTRDVYISKSTENINSWGVLQHFGTLNENENGKAKADALLKLYNSKTRTLSVNKAFGDIRVRAGSMVVVVLGLGDINVKNLMLVEKCKHEFKEGHHFMTLNLRGGEFIA